MKRCYEVLRMARRPSRMQTVQEIPPPRLNPIGRWSFDSLDGILRGPDGERKMEDRAARTLAFLCEHRGEIVSRTSILAAVWQGRQVSSNSVAVVVADLRRILEDDARDPVHIETVAKRGYRLKLDPLTAPDNLASEQLERRRGPLRYLALPIAALVMTLGTAVWLGYGSPERHIIVEPVRNDTGKPGYGALAGAMSELLVNRISTFKSVDVSRAQNDATHEPVAGIVVQSRLILWNGIPTLSMTSQDQSGHVVWSGMVMGPPDTLASKTIDELAGLQKSVR